jgi:hypothetical protein
VLLEPLEGVPAAETKNTGNELEGGAAGVAAEAGKGVVVVELAGGGGVALVGAHGAALVGAGAVGDGELGADSFEREGAGDFEAGEEALVVGDVVVIATAALLLGGVEEALASLEAR